MPSRLRGARRGLNESIAEEMNEANVWGAADEMDELEKSGWYYYQPYSYTNSPTPAPTTEDHRDACGTSGFMSSVRSVSAAAATVYHYHGRRYHAAYHHHRHTTIIAKQA